MKFRKSGSYTIGIINQNAANVVGIISNEKNDGREGLNY